MSGLQALIYPPEYDLSRAPELRDGYYYLYDNLTLSYTGKLTKNSGTESWTSLELSARLDTVKETIDLSAGYEIYTGKILSNVAWYFSIPYNISASTWDIVALENNGDGTADRWDGDETTPLAETHTGLNYEVPATEFVIGEYFAYNSVPNIPFCTIELDDYELTVGETAVITIRFNTVPANFTADDIIVQNGLVSNFQQTAVPYIYTALFTPTADVSDNTNIVTVKGSLGEYADLFNNLSITDATSANYTVNTTSYVVNHVSLNDAVATPTIAPPAGVTINDILAVANTNVAILDANGVSQGITISSPDFNDLTSGLVSTLMLGRQLEHCWWSNSLVNITLTFATAGTYRIETVGAADTTSNYETVHTVDSIPVQFQAAGNTTVKPSWDVAVTAGESITIGVEPAAGSSVCIINAIDITRVA